MNLSQLTTSATTTTSTQSAASTTTSATTPISRALAKTESRIQSQLDVANSQISSLGKLKSGVSDAQLAGKALSALNKTSTAADVKTAATRFIADFNAALSAARSSATASSASPQGAGSATRIKTDLTRAVSGDSNTVDALKRLGMTQSADGSLSLDAKKWDAAQKADPAAVQSALAKVGQSVDKAATKALASDGNLAGSMTSLTQQAATVKSHQTALLAMEQRLAAAQTSSSSSSYAGQGLAAYLANS